VAAHPKGVVDLDVGPERGAQAVQRGDGVGREDGGAAAAQGARHGRVRPEDGDAAQR
jgi:hypothetical protein